MSEQQNRIATLLNSGSDTSADPSTGAATPGTYDISPGQSASDTQLGIDSAPDALISVDGHQVAAGDSGLSIDVAPDGSTHVIHAPQDGTQPGGVQTPGTVGVPTQLVQNGTPVTGQNGTPVTGQDGTPVAGQDGTQVTGQNGTLPPGSDPTGSGASPQGQPDQSGVSQDGTQPTGDGTADPGSAAAAGQSDPTGTAPDPSQDTTPVEHLHGTGDHAAQADLAVHGPDANMPAPVTHQNPDGSQDITIPKGPDNPQAITVHVQSNKDGSLDLTVPKSDTNPHEIKIHVQPDKHVDLNITQDKDGHLKIDAHDHPPEQQGDWAGLKGPAGQNDGQGTDPAQQAGAPQDGSVPVSDIPQQPDASAASPGGGGSGDLPSAGSGGDPTAGGIPSGDTPSSDVPSGGVPSGGVPSGGVPSGAGSPTAKSQPPATPVKTVPVADNGTLDVDGAEIKKRGTDLVNGPVKTLDTAAGHARDIGIGFPGFGALGSPLQMIHGALTDTAATELQQGSSTLSSTSTSLATTGETYADTEIKNGSLVQNTGVAGDKTNGP
ncbi:hypothetical protein GCM10027176_65610 [Actinoallomurus bryophytorum]|uniref:Uncharacterized protein n=1 Tax=Actinoallomurus bryophytorum TaxID=1490222 RepID=A0A543CGW9_9ACTN|nr:hypothetical protein [Actinoallomurus bryophytorum]TQL96339.1 hypothetical protein FB559_1865 [Actinoallomurus bryophytorum]